MAKILKFMLVKQESRKRKMRIKRSTTLLLIGNAGFILYMAIFVIGIQHKNIHLQKLADADLKNRLISTVFDTNRLLSPKTESPDQFKIRQYSFDPEKLAQLSKINCTQTVMTPSYKICPHQESMDEIVSGSLSSMGSWELPVRKSLARCPPGSTFIDIGAQLGAHALFAAALNYPVLALEPNELNWPNLHKAVLLNNFQDRFTLLPYGVSNSHQVVKLYRNAKNMGHAYILLRGAKPETETVEIGNISTIVLNDLIPFVKTNTSVMKIDIETHECKLFDNKTNFEKLFSHTKIPEIFMEWGFQKDMENKTCVTEMGRTLLSMGYKAETGAGESLEFDFKSKTLLPSDWPMDIIWKHKSLQKN